MASGLILVVDDEEAIREILKLSLSMEGFTVEVAANGQEALDLLSNNLPAQIILLDLMMPIMDGWNFLKQKSQIEKIREIPVIILSAFADKAKAPDVIANMSKPFNFDDLLGVITRNIEKKAS
jgi:two-component system, chemotaxis family, chemotaxis protein CheY